MKFYYHLLSQPSRALYIFLKLNNIPAEFITINFPNGDHLTDEFKEINRFQKVPCIVDDDGWKLSESIAILRYLMSKYKSIPDHFYPSDIRARAAVDEYLEWQHINTRFSCGVYFQLRKKIDGLDTLWLRGKKFLCSDEISFADIIAACEIEQARMTGDDLFENRPKLKEWYERVKETTNPYYDEAHVIVNKIVTKNQKPKL
ncbi:hypothetical protein PVAND_016125 [Polypedilum vanderplanki]|uniref:Glutathione S-transferase n=1 Tax=Polypedilum vanderplanki TaxID=319348 RepID=A0A9J6BEY3_POLVA|nr:hypothetical protein PVAND_016125 [Polypedilum vanderplanki]